MFRLLAPRSSRLCDGLTRRDVLRVGTLSALGGGLSLLHLDQAAARSPQPTPPTPGKARSCIILFLMGGPPQHSTWDPKPDAPIEVRGAFGPIDTAVPGLQLSELMPRCASVADKLCILRAVSTGDHAHSSSGYYMLTGRPHAPTNFENANPGPPNDFPSIGALAGRLIPPATSALPGSITLPHRIFNTDGSVWPGQDAGFLGQAANPWLLNAQLTPAGYQIAELALPAELDHARLGARHALQQGIENLLHHADQHPSLSAFDAYSQRALDMLRSPAVRKAFQLDEESEATRQSYGMTPFGQSVLQARRLVEAGTRLVQVNWYRGPDEPPMNPCWDSHVDETNRLKNVLVPPTDAALAALISDLDQRGLLDETLVICMSEFGRSPRLDAAGGRGHWGNVFSVALAGGGIQGGQVIGASDKFAAYPRDHLVRPEDLQATLLSALGVDPLTHYTDPLGRPHVVSRGEVIPGVF